MALRSQALGAIDRLVRGEPGAPAEPLAVRLRREAGAFLVDGFFEGVARAGKLHPLADPARHGVEVLRDLPYLDGGGPERHLDVWRPSARAAPLPVVLYLHGGGFRILSKDTHWVFGLVFARQGYVTFVISYRLSPRHPFPAAVEDACDAYRWVVGNAPRLGGDPSRLVLAGESAGANLATALALAACTERPEPFARRVFDGGVVPRAVVPACGLLQVTDAARFTRSSAFVQDRIAEVGDAYLRGVVPAHPTALDLADPLVALERDEPTARPLPPFFVPCGTWDPLAEDSLRLGRALARRGVAVETKLYPREPHAFHAFVPRAGARRCWADTFDFLARHDPPAPPPARR